MTALPGGSHAGGLTAQPAPAVRYAERMAQRAAVASVVTAVILIALKAWAANETGSIAVLASLADSGLDLIASLITLGGVRWAAAPADEDHRFGHGKAEALAAFCQACLILASAAFILNSAWDRLGTTASPVQAEFGVGVSVVAILITLGLLRVQTAAVRASGSVAIAADRTHYAADLGLNLSVIAALALETLAGVRGADAVFGVGIAAYLAVGAAVAGKRAIDVLMDREWPDSEVERLKTVAGSAAEVRSVHEVRTRGRGVHSFAQLHIWVDPEMTVAAAHEVVDGVEARVGRAFPGIELIVHVDPEGHFDARPGPAKRA